jgi:endonuclease/exonuclease/phosphatase family metal-dependent hydrolase
MGLIFGRSGRRSRSRGRRSVLNKLPMMRWVGPGTTLAGILATIVGLLTGKIDLSSLDTIAGRRDEASVAAAPVSLEQLGQRSDETIRIATFNIQVFGEKKSTSRLVDGVDILGTLAKIVSRFDVVAIQEVRGGDAAPIERLINLVNRSGGNYTGIVSQPIGRTSQTECYAYVWDRSRIQMFPGSAYVVQDGADRMHREPMVASFQTRAVAVDGRMPFSFTLINAHTDPDEVSGSSPENEINVLDDVFVRVRAYEYQSSGEEDCILLGDLNVDKQGLGELLQIPSMISVAGDMVTNTRRTKTYDHLLIDYGMTREYTGRFGVLDLQDDLGLTEQQALRISDHMPVWAEFTAFEMPRYEATAARGAASFR